VKTKIQQCHPKNNGRGRGEGLSLGTEGDSWSQEDKRTKRKHQPLRCGRLLHSTATSSCQFLGHVGQMTNSRDQNRTGSGSHKGIVDFRVLQPSSCSFLVYTLIPVRFAIHFPGRFRERLIESLKGTQNINMRDKGVRRVYDLQNYVLMWICFT
jgi:hypothetical protein